ncbi:MAG: hypothetical protein Q4F71_02145 [Paracoccus sp. (in: a-proteobacteria)]|nr:hypothetical protein [Paracoccus sp. (in: a-proteobacteria)]
MQRAIIQLLALSALTFIVSSVLFALQPIARTLKDAAREMPGTIMDPVRIYTDAGNLDGTDLVTLFVQPRDTGMWILLIAVWLAVTLHTLEVLHNDYRRREISPSDHFPLIFALLAGAVWPWLLASFPALAVIGAVAMLVGVITIAIRGEARQAERREVRIYNSPMIAVFGAWATLVALSAFGTALIDVGAPAVGTASFVLLLACAAGATIQLQAQRGGAYTITLIFAFLSLAAAVLDTNPIVSMAAVMAIAAMTFVLVQVMT